MEFADERSVVQTRFATATLALLRAHLGEDLGPVIAEAERALVEPIAAEDLDAVEHFVFLGHGWSVGIAEEAALKLREAAQARTPRHIPRWSTDTARSASPARRTLVWVVGTPDPSIVARRPCGRRHRFGRRRSTRWPSWCECTA